MLVTVQDIDALWKKIDKTVEQIAESLGTIRRQKFEADLIALYGDARDKIEVVLRMGREILVDIFGGDCMRIAHLGVILERQEFSTPGAVNDQRTGMCRNMCSNVEGVLRDLGLSEGLKGARNAEERKWRQAWTAEKYKTPIAVSNVADSTQRGNEEFNRLEKQCERRIIGERTNSPNAHVNDANSRTSESGQHVSSSFKTTNDGHNRPPAAPQLQSSSKAGLQDDMLEARVRQRDTSSSQHQQATPLPVQQRESSLSVEELEAPVPAEEPKTPPQVHVLETPVSLLQRKLARERDFQEMEHREKARHQRKMKRLESNASDVVQPMGSKNEGAVPEANSNPLDMPEHVGRTHKNILDTLPPVPKPEDFGIKERPPNSNWRASFPIMRPSENFEQDSPRPLRQLDSPAKALLASPARSTLNTSYDRSTIMVPRRVLADKSPAMSKEAFKPRRILRKRTPSPQKTKVRQSMPPWTLSTRESLTPQMQESSDRRHSSRLTLHGKASCQQSSRPSSPPVVTSSIPVAISPQQHEVKDFIALNVASVTKGLTGESRRESRASCREKASSPVEKPPRRRAASLAAKKQNLVCDRENQVNRSPNNHRYKATKGVECDLSNPTFKRSENEVKNFIMLNTANVMNGSQRNSRRESRACCREMASSAAESRPWRRTQSLTLKKQDLVCDEENGVEQSPNSEHEMTKGVERDLRSPASGRSEQKGKNFIALNATSARNELQGESRRGSRCESASSAVETKHNEGTRSVPSRGRDGVCERENGIERFPQSHRYKQEEGAEQVLRSLSPSNRDEDIKSSSALVGILKKPTDDNDDLPIPANESSPTTSVIDYPLARAETSPGLAREQKRLPEPISPLSLTSNNGSSDSQLPIFDLTPKQFSTAGREQRERHDNRMLHTPITYSPKTFITGCKNTSTVARSRQSRGLMASLICASAPGYGGGGKCLTSVEVHGGSSSSTSRVDSNSDIGGMEGGHENDSPRGNGSTKKLSLSCFQSEDEIGSGRSRNRSVSSENSKKTFCHDSDKYGSPKCDDEKNDRNDVEGNKNFGVPITPPPKKLFNSDDDYTLHGAPLLANKLSASDYGCAESKSVDEVIVDVSSPNINLSINDFVPVTAPGLPQVSPKALSASASLDTTVESQPEKDSAIRTSTSPTATTTDARVVTAPRVRKSVFSGIFQKPQVVESAKTVYPTAHCQQKAPPSYSTEKENIFSGSEVKTKQIDDQPTGRQLAPRISNDGNAASKDKQATSCQLKTDHAVSRQFPFVLTRDEPNGGHFTRQQTPRGSNKEVYGRPSFSTKTTPYVPQRGRGPVSRSNSGSPRFCSFNNSAARSVRSSSSTAGVTAFPPRTTPFVPRQPRSVMSSSNSGSPRLHALNSAARDGQSGYRTLGVASDLPWVIERRVTDESLLVAFRLLDHVLGSERLKAIDEEEAVDVLREKGYPARDAYYHVIGLLYLNHLRLEEL